MKISTKYNVGDKVWILEQDGKHLVTITDIRADVCNRDSLGQPSLCQAVIYQFNKSDSARLEEDVFGTEEELLERINK